MKALLSVAVITGAVLTATPASAAIINFDDIISGVNFAAVHNGYAGLNWDNFFVGNSEYVEGPGFAAGAISGEYVAVNGYANPASILAISGTFSFDGGWFTSGWHDDTFLLIEGFTDDDDLPDYSLTLPLDTLTPLFLSVNWTGLQRLTFTSSNDVVPSLAHFVLDDLRINVSTTTEVPEPLTIGLFGLGLLGIAGARRRRN